MVICRICGDNKEASDFKTIPNFTKYKKHTVSWCKECQKLFLDMKRGKEKLKKLKETHFIFDVSFN